MLSHPECQEVNPETGARCDLRVGHSGKHWVSWRIPGAECYTTWGEERQEERLGEEVQFVVVSIPEPHVRKREFLTKIKDPAYCNWWSTYLPWAETFDSLVEAESLIKKLPPEYRNVAEVTKVIFTPRYEHYT